MLNTNKKHEHNLAKEPQFWSALLCINKMHCVFTNGEVYFG